MSDLFNDTLSDIEQLEAFSILEKAFENGQITSETLEKARKGVYKDTSENRKFKRVGQPYGSKKADVPTGNKAPKKDDGKPVGDAKQENGKVTPEAKQNLSEHAKATSESDLQNAVKTSSDPEVRKQAHEELDRRTKEEHVQEEEKPVKTESNKESTDKEKVSDKKEGSVESESNKPLSLLERYRLKKERGEIKEEKDKKTINDFISEVPEGDFDIESEAKKQGFWKDRASGAIKQNEINQGSESVVYKYGNNNVVKVNNMSQYDSYKEALDAIQKHNEVFPETAYKILGFTKNDEGETSMILKQRYLPNLENATKNDIIKDMKERGYDYIRGNAYGNKDTIIDDLTLSDVFKDKEGDLYYIDSRIKKNDKR